MSTPMPSRHAGRVRSSIPAPTSCTSFASCPPAASRSSLASSRRCVDARRATLTCQIDVAAIVDRTLKSAMTAAVTDLLPICAQLAETGSDACEVDWSKVKGMEFREALNERTARVDELEALPVDTTDEFEATVRRSRGH